MQQIIEVVDAVQGIWAEAEAMYRETNAIPRTEELSAHDWLTVEAVKQQLQMTEGSNGKAYTWTVGRHVQWGNLDSEAR